jgi:crotonobetainyl-CoA:carnitine CoA-transferase CaiB-like acyl-CoA transferase
MARPLDGIRVLDLSRLLPGPFCTLVLSDLGAHVDKVEDPHVGDYLRFMPPVFPAGGAAASLSGRYAAINRDKRSAGRAALLRLLPRYDVLLESFRPGVLERLGLSVETLHAHNPRLVVCAISGYGQDGPYRDRAGHDLNYSALAGVLGVSGASPTAPPHPLPIQLADLGAGGLWAAIGILGALRTAERTGKGSYVDIAMCEGTLSFLLPDLGNLDAQGADAVSPERGNDLLTGGMACYSVYTTADGKFLSVAALEPKFWQNLNTVLGRATDPSELVAPPAEQQRIRAELQAIFQTRSRAAWETIFAAADACVEPILELSELSEHPQHAAREVFFAIATPHGPLPQVRTPLLPRGTAARVPPTRGEHSVTILEEAGFSATEIAALQKAGVTA